MSLRRIGIAALYALITLILLGGVVAAASAQPSYGSWKIRVNGWGASDFLHEVTSGGLHGVSSGEWIIELDASNRFKSEAVVVSQWLARILNEEVDLFLRRKTVDASPRIRAAIRR